MEKASVNIQSGSATLQPKKQFSIKQLENFTGIKEHTIRIWEKRYGFIKPQRKAGNRRTYTYEELKCFLIVVSLAQNGWKISLLATMTARERQALMEKLLVDGACEQCLIFQLILAMYAYEIEYFEALFDAYVQENGYDKGVEKILIPFIEKIGLSSYGDQASDVHFVVTVIRKKLISSIEQLAAPAKSSRAALLYLPIGEHFDLILLYLAYLLKRFGWLVWYLGTDVSMENLASVLAVKQPGLLLTYQCPKQSMHLESYSYYLQKYLTTTRFLVAKWEKGLLDNDPNAVDTYFHFTQILHVI